MDGPRDCHTEGSKSERQNQISYINVHRKMEQMILFVKQKERHRHREQIHGYQGGKSVVGEIGR